MSCFELETSCRNAKTITSVLSIQKYIEKSDAIKRSHYNNDLRQKFESAS